MTKGNRNFWDFVAPIYDFAQKSGFAELLEIIKKQIPENATVLECAAGTGEISIAVADRAAKVVCTDTSAKMLVVARKKIAKRSIKNIEISLCDIYQTGFADNTFDIVIASQVLHLLAEPQKAAAEL
ncbi:MAG: class I SAM-dependent methyltransferase, partial [Dysgonamonadaceae bacterium]|nr:class I SAM-dependent methyltransferase [Dysgonamonadaceae bacterium]